MNSIGETIAGTAFSTSFTYDTYGRLSTRTHPSGIVETLGYNSNGYMATISAGGSIQYTITSQNAREQLTGATYGSSLTASYGFDTYGYPLSTSAGTIQDYRYSFDPVTGNLNSRQNYKRSLSESFSYTDNGDNLDRLTSVTGPQNLTMKYADNGNILTKSDISNTTQFSYGSGAGPYALTGLTSSTGIIPTISQNATYTSFEKVNTLNEGAYIATFAYNSDDQRAKMDVIQSGTTILTRWYAGSRYMKETASGVTKEYTYIGGDAYNAPVVAITQSGTTNYFYLLRDYLGNITHQVNTSNTVVAEYNFDAWGRRRSADDWSYTLDANDLALVADRGFTGHEHLTMFNLVNMNGRLYDPILGRFLSPDPYVQMPDYSQNFNRYSYCLNNPLKYNDLSGELFGIDDAVLIYIAISAVHQGVMSGLNAQASGKSFFGGFWKGTAVGLATGIVTQGIGTAVSGMYSNFGQSLIMGGTAFATSSLGSIAINGGKWDWKGSLMAGGLAFGMNYWNGMGVRKEFKAACARSGDLPVNSDGSITYTDQNAKDYYENWFNNEYVKEIYTGGKGTNSDIHFKNGQYIYGGKEANGLTDAIKNSQYSNLYFSKSAFSSKWQLYMTMGHENVHVLDYAFGRWNPTSITSTGMSDIRAYNWQMDQNMRYRTPGNEFFNHPAGIGQNATLKWMELRYKYGYYQWK